MSIDRLKRAAIISFVVAMGGPLIGGIFATRDAPPYPGTVTGPDGKELFTRADIFSGQDVFQRYGLRPCGRPALRSRRAPAPAPRRRTHRIR